MRSERTTTKRNAAIAVIALALVAWAVPAGAQQGNTNTGTIKVHDAMTADPPQRNEPHVDCDFWVQGFRMSGDGGELVVYSWPPTGDKAEVLRVEWDGEAAADGKGFDFLVGPLSLAASGHFRVEAFVGDEVKKSKSKMFWVECEEEPETPPENPPEEPACPTGLRAVANQDGSVTLRWTVAAGSDGTNIYRSDGEGDFEYVTTVEAGVATYTDTTTVAGNAYGYLVTALYGSAESEGCGEVMVTAIPDFPVPLAGALAAAGGLLAYAGLRRKR